MASIPDRHALRLSSRTSLVAPILLALAGLALLSITSPLHGQDSQTALPDYRAFPIIGSRIAVWIAAEIHLLFAAFVLGVPMFAVVAEAIGVKTGDARYDRLARDCTKFLLISFSIMTIFGALLLFLLIGLYPKFFNYLAGIFLPTMVVYVLLFFGEALSLYFYWYTWDRLRDRKGLHLTFGVLLNIFGTLLMFAANAWATFMLSPAGVDETGNLLSLWGAVNNQTWWALNIHRLIGNLAYGGFIVGAYAAYRYMLAATDEDRAQYDWMGYVGNFIGVMWLIPLPFAGYYFGLEIYRFSEQLGITMMGGIFSWLFIIQAFLVGMLFLTSNYYLWLSMDRIEGAERYTRWTKWMMVVLMIAFAIWATPHSLVGSIEEARKIGGAHHPILGVMGVMSAKNTVVNLIILTTFLNFLFYRRANKSATVSWERGGKMVQGLIFGLVAAAVLFLGIYGYYVPAHVRIRFSIYQVLLVLFTLISAGGIDIFLYRRAKEIGPIRWGEIAPRSQYALLLLAILAVLMMGLMGYARSGGRQNWHVYGVMRDISPDAFTPTLGYATLVISAIVLIYMGFLAFVFWFAGLGEEKAAVGAAYSRVHGAVGSGNPNPNSQGRSTLRVILKGAAFTVATVAVFVFLGQWVPQVGMEAGGEATGLVEGEVTAEELVATGRELFFGRGGCSLCHSIEPVPTPRAPVLQGVGGHRSRQYFLQTLYHPQAYIVEGFPNIMPPANKPPAALSHPEIQAVVAFLQSLGGTPELPPAPDQDEVPEPREVTWE